MSNSTIYTGTTNTDGTGSSANLNSENASNSLTEGTHSDVTDINNSFLYNQQGILTSATASGWNANGEKEVSIDNDSAIVYVKDFVDVNISNTNSDGSEISVLNAKRGSITTDDGDDTINLSVYSNNNHWVNHFDIDTGDGNDNVTMYNSLNSENTSFDINLGDGNDSLDVSGLLDPASTASRNADGGDGTDTLTLSGQDSVSFENFEVVIGSDDNFGTGVTVDSDLLADNNSSALGLIFSNVDVTLDDDVSVNSGSVSSLSDAQVDYLTSELGTTDTSDYVSVTLTDHDGSDYTIITDDADYSALLA